MNSITFTEATQSDLPSIIALLHDDEVGKKREQLTDPLLPCYIEAFDAIHTDSNAHLITVKNADQTIGMAQLNFIRYLTYQGGAHLVQLTTDKTRPKAYAFYQQLGFVHSHDGFKLHL